MMLIVCAGRSRSGSTLLYNIVRLTIVEFVGKNKVYSRGISHYNRKSELEYNIVKLHDTNNSYFYDNADYVFSSHRNETDQKKSILKFRKIMKDQVLTDKQLNQFVGYDAKRYKKWSSHPNFYRSFDFNMLVNDKQTVVKEICSILDFDINNDKILTVVNTIDDLKLPSKNKIMDPETCLTWHHFTSKEN